MGQTWHLVAVEYPADGRAWNAEMVADAVGPPSASETQRDNAVLTFLGKPVG